MSKEEDLTLEERFEELEKQNFALLAMLLEVAEGMANLSEVFLKHMQEQHKKKTEQMN